MLFLTSLVLGLSFGIAFGSDCKDVSGVWQNQLGSNMTLFRRTENKLTGEYSTAVESKLRAALVTSNVTGTYSTVKDGALLSFSVLFNHGKSLTTWVGQCMVCDGEEILFTTWNLRTHFLKHQDRWMSVRVGQDTFRRMREEETNTIPFHLRTMGPLPKDEVSTVCEKNIGAGGKAQWTSTDGEIIEFGNCYESGIISGMSSDSPVYGRSAGGGPFTAFGFVSTTSKVARGWTGYVYETPSQRRTIETAWLSHKFSNSCKQPRSFVGFGTQDYSFSYTREELKEQDSAFRRFLNFFTAWFK